MKAERVHWIDIAKGIGIIFIIYAHMLAGNDFRHLFYSFHIPLFFFLSGAVYNHKKYVNLFTFLKKSAKGLLLPYLIFAFISYALWLIEIKTNNLFSPETIRQFLSIFYAFLDSFHDKIQTLIYDIEKRDKNQWLLCVKFND